MTLIDADPQGSLTAWWNAREAETPVLAQPDIRDLTGRLLKLRASGFAFVIIDTPPALTDAIRAVVRQANLVIVPVKPSPHDLRAVGGTVELVQGEGRAFAFVATQAKGNALLTVQAVAALSDMGASGLIATKGAAAPVSDMPTRSPATAKEKGPAKTMPLNFKVRPEFGREFKRVAVDHGLKLNELLEEALAAYVELEGRNGSR